MSQEDAEFWKRAYQARDKLADQFLFHPDVSLIDIGRELKPREETQDLVLRIHVRERWFKAETEKRLAFPAEIDGIRVIVMRADYGLESDVASNDENE
jgi:hypothetical protein